MSERDRYWCNFSIGFIDFFAWLGWAYDLKTGFVCLMIKRFELTRYFFLLVSDEMIRKRVMRTGDGSHRYAKADLTEIKLNKESEKDVRHYWGFGETMKHFHQKIKKINIFFTGDDDMLDDEMKNIKTLHKKEDD